MPNGKNFDEPVFVIHAVNYSIIADSYSVIMGLSQFLRSRRSGVSFKGEYLLPNLAASAGWKL
jgi:hypothetical protein